MKIFRIIICGLFAAVTAVFLFFVITETIKNDESVPFITLESDMLDVSLKADSEEMLKGVTAYDKKDGDITDRVFVESISRFTKKGICNVTYAVCDNDNHVTKITRKIRFKDYHSPVITLNESLCYSIYEVIDLTKTFTATDCIQGDISNSILLTSNASGMVAGVYNISVTATNKYGDSTTESFPLIIDDTISPAGPVIELKQYSVNVKKGSTVDFGSYIVSAADVFENDVTSSVRFETDADLNKEGTYTVHYYAIDSSNNTGHAILVVNVGN